MNMQLKFINNIIKADHNKLILWLLFDVNDRVETRQISIPEAYNEIAEEVKKYNSSKCKHCRTMDELNSIGLCSICDHHFKLKASEEIILEEDYDNGTYGTVLNRLHREANLVF